MQKSFFYVLLCLYILGSFLSISKTLNAIDLGDKTDYRFDQVVPPGCKPKWMGAESVRISRDIDNIALNCDGVDYDYWYTNMSTSFWSLGSKTNGKVTGAARGGVVPAAWWVNGSGFDNNGDQYVNVCNSASYFMWISEGCQRVYINRNGVRINRSDRVAVAKTFQFGTLKPGKSSETSPYNIDDDSFSHRSYYEVNSNGYVFQLYNNDCPYNNQGGNIKTCIKDDSIKDGYTFLNNCYLLKDANISVSCPKESECLCSPKSSLIPCSKCIPDKSGKTPEGCKCNSQGKECVCDDSQIVQCNENFIPKNNDPLFPALKNEQLKCFSCYATGRKLYNNCSSSVDSGYKNIKIMIQQGGLKYLKKAYGPGTYICAFSLDLLTRKYTRIGCVKGLPGPPPPNFPRIARYSSKSLSTSDMFIPTASVRQFRDMDYMANNPHTGVCGYGSAELGELSRGTFFKPKMHVIFGELDTEITFDIQSQMYTQGTPDMIKMYGETSSLRIVSARNNNSTVNTPWNNPNDIPITINYGRADGSCNITQDTSIQAKICTRIESEPDSDYDSYVAYQVRGETCSTCSNCESVNGLIKIGSVPRPPIKYIYSKGSPKVAISVDAMKITKGSNDPNMVTVDPHLIPSKEESYHTGLSSMQVGLYPEYFNVVGCAYSKIQTDDCIKNMPTKTEDPSCGILFGRIFCVQREKCAVLFDLSIYATAEIKTPNCTTINCQLYERLKTECEPKTYCPSISKDLNSCFNGPPQNLVTKTNTIDYYKKNIQWFDETCISSGFSQLLHSKSTIDDSVKYGTYGDISYDTVISFAQDFNNASTPRPIRSGNIDDDAASGTIVPVPESVATNVDISGAATYLSQLVDASSTSISMKYFNTQNATTIESSIGLRPRTQRELNLCGTNLRNMYTNWDSVFNNGYGYYDIYLPLRCQYFEYELIGSRGGGTGLNNMAYDHYTTCTLFGCTDWGCKTSWGLAGVENSVGNIECRYAGSFEWFKFNSQTGSEGGNAFGMFNNLSHKENFLSFYLAKGATTLTSGNTCFIACGDGQSCGYRGSGYVDARDEQTESSISFILPSPKLTRIRSKFVKANGGKSNFNTCSAYYLKGNTATDILTFLTGDIYGDESFIAKTSDGNGVSMTRSSSFISGEQGTAALRSPKIRIDQDKIPIYQNGYTKILEKNKIRDPECLPMCPRINIALKVGDKDLICEYGGAAYSSDGAFISTSSRDFQIPSGYTAIPTRCFSDDGTIIYHPNSSFFNAICTNNTVLSKNRFYGLCSNSQSYDESSYLNEFFNSSESYWSMAGTYCPQDDCPVTKLSQNGAIQNLTVLGDIYLYGLKCLDGGMWESSPGTNKPIKQISDLPLYCPKINPDIFDFPGEWSMNVYWPKTEAGAIADGAKCRTGFIKNNSTSTFSRRCGLSGVWEGVSDIINNVCLYSCQLDIDVENYIQWDMPNTFSNPISIPTCTLGPVKTYIEGQLVEKNVQYVWPSGMSGNNFKRLCNMPATSDPLRYSYVDSTTTDINILPYWNPRPSGAKCIPPSFPGTCFEDLNVCYDSAVDQNMAFGSCYNGAVYSINGIPTYPPSQLVSGSSLIKNTITSLYMIGNDSYSICTFKKTTTTSAMPFMPYSRRATAQNVNCDKLDVNVDIKYFDPTYNIYYYLKKISISTNENINVTSLAITYNDAGATSSLMEIIQNDYPLDIDQCRLNENSLNYDIISRYMISNENNIFYCSQICYLPNLNKMQFFDCTQTNHIPLNASCAPVCGQTAETYGYYESVGLTSTPPAGQTPLVPALSMANTNSCIKNGLLSAIPFLHKNGIDEDVRIGNYCDIVSYKGIIPPSANLTISTTNPIFNQKFDSSDYSCKIPQNCTLPNSAILNHQLSAWVWIFDPSINFGYTATSTGICDNGEEYYISASNIIFIKLYCYDGNLFTVEKLQNIMYESSTENTCFATKPTLEQVIGFIQEASLENISKLPSITYQETSNPEVFIDTRTDSFESYNNFRKLDIL